MIDSGIGFVPRSADFFARQRSGRRQQHDVGHLVVATSRGVFRLSPSQWIERS